MSFFWMFVTISWHDRLFLLYSDLEQRLHGSRVSVPLGQKQKQEP